MRVVDSAMEALLRNLDSTEIAEAAQSFFDTLLDGSGEKDAVGIAVWDSSGCSDVRTHVCVPHLTSHCRGGIGVGV